MQKLKLQYFGHLMQRVDSLEKTLILGLGAGGEEDDWGWDGWMASPTRWSWVWVNSGSWWWTGRPGVLQFMGSQRVGHDWATELNWTEMYFLNGSKVYKTTRETTLFTGKAELPRLSCQSSAMSLGLQALLLAPRPAGTIWTPFLFSPQHPPCDCIHNHLGWGLSTVSHYFTS